MEAIKIFNKKLMDYLYIITDNDKTLISNQKGIEKHFKICLIPEAIPTAGGNQNE